MPAPPALPSAAQLRSLTERLASSSNPLDFLRDVGLPALPGPLTQKFLNQAAQAATPPALPVLQLLSRHQEPVYPERWSDAAAEPRTGRGGAQPKQGKQVKANGVNGTAHPHSNEIAPPPLPPPQVTCPAGIKWPEWNQHSDKRCSRCEEEELQEFEDCMSLALRREFDCWVEQCWTEAFHHIFTRVLPLILIHLILTGATPTTLRRNIVQGGPNLTAMLQEHLLAELMTEHEARLSGFRSAEAGPSRPSPSSASNPVGAAAAAAAAALNTLNPLGSLDSLGASGPLGPRDGVCFHDLAVQHGLQPEEDEHALCLCQLVACTGCFRNAAERRKGPLSLLPYEYTNAEASIGWAGRIETKAQARARQELLWPPPPVPQPLPPGGGFVKNSKKVNGQHGDLLPPPLFPHPQMTDVLAVEEHMRWRLKELGAPDPAVEARYGPCGNSPAALEGIELEEGSEEGSQAGAGAGTAKGGNKVVKVTKGRGKARRVVGNAVVKKGEKEKGKQVYLPKTWVDEDAGARNMAMILTFRHLVKLLYQTACAYSPFYYSNYTADVIELSHMHPIALYRRLTEPSVLRHRPSREARIWQECMDKWGEEFGLREKAEGNRHVNVQDYGEAIEYYTRAISLDGKKTVYYSNRAVALNAIEHHERAEADCKHILSKDAKNGKAFYQRALARAGLGRWREAEADLKEVLKLQPGNETAKKQLGAVKAEIAKLPKQRAEEAMNF